MTVLDVLQHWTRMDCEHTRGSCCKHGTFTSDWDICKYDFQLYQHFWHFDNVHDMTPHIYKSVLTRYFY